MKRILLFIALSVFAANYGYAQGGKAWTVSASKNVKPSKNVQRASFPDNFTLFQANPELMRQSLASAPQRLSGKKSGTIITMPNANGGLEQFEVFEFSNFEPALQAQFPQIRSYAGTGIDDKLATIRMSIDPSGIQAMVFRTDKRNEFIEPFSEDGKTYAVYNSERTKGKLPFVCSTEDVMVAQTAERTAESRALSNSGELLVFRLALSCNGEYTTFFGGTVAGSLAAFNATMTRVNGVFEKDFSIHMNIIANTTAVIYTNAATDPYTGLNSWNGQLQNTLTANIGEANYDIGHMFGASGGGGNAGCIGCVCVNGQKGSGITSPADGVPMGDTFDIDYVAHEMGHQFGGNHTFSNNVEGSGVNVEPGSGSTIMGYAGITNQDIQAHSDDYFVYASIKQIQDNMVGKTCPVRTTLSNVGPIVNAGPDYTIPKSTPFVMTGSGTDANGDAITYCWEENDSATTQTGANSQANATKTGGPNWRSYSPVSTPTRYFPPLPRVIANQTTSVFGLIRTEAISSVARTLNFVLTGRDNVAGIGQTGSDAMVVTVNGTAGPFLVSVPNTNVSWEAGSNQTVTWDVAGTTANNVNAAFVDIYLSNDGGLTYPTLLASKVPNDGSEVVNIPNTVGTTNRVMIKGWNHIFYDISNANFTITAAPSTFAIDFSRVAGGENKSICTGGTQSYNISYATLNGFAGNTTLTAAGQPAGSTVTFAPATIASTGTIVMTVANTAAATPGFYPITVTATSGSIVKTVSLYFELFSSNFLPTTVISPANGATTQNTTLSLNWAADANASSYDVQVATDNTFTNIISAATVQTNTFSVTGLLEATIYYWRILPKNTSCEGVFSPASSFQTGQIACDGFTSANVPLAISATGTPTVNSTLTIPASSDATIADVNITLNIQHTWINDLTVTLISPNGTLVKLVDGPCTSESILNIVGTFDDSGSNVVCGTNPGISGVVKPIELLSAFNGQNSAGVWTLRVKDNFNQDGGSLVSWSLNVCSTQPLGTADNHLSNFAIYPNPNNGNFNVQFTPNSDDVKINVHDIRGRQIFSKSYNNGGLFNENLQLNNVQAGMYLVTVQNGNQKEVKKIIIE